MSRRVKYGEVFQVCPNCGRVHKAHNYSICPACRKAREAKERRLRSRKRKGRVAVPPAAAVDPTIVSYAHSKECGTVVSWRGCLPDAGRSAAR